MTHISRRFSLSFLGLEASVISFYYLFFLLDPAVHMHLLVTTHLFEHFPTALAVEQPASPSKRPSIKIFNARAASTTRSVVRVVERT